MRLVQQPGVDRVVARIQGAYAGWTRSTPVQTMRTQWDTLFDSAPSDAVVTPVICGTRGAEFVAMPGADPGPVILYLHGGGYRIGSPRSHRGLAAALAGAAGCRVLTLDYRLAPEHPFPAAVEDSCAAYAWLRGQVPRCQVAMAGDSAGAGLALATLLAARDAGIPLPAAAVLMSPWTDLTASGPSYQERADADPLNQRAALLAMARGYLCGADPADPMASPVFGDLRGLPPLLLQVGSREIVHSDAATLAARAQAASVPAEFQEWPGMVHVFQQFPAELPQADQALAAAGRFLRRHLGLASDGVPA